MADRIDDPLYGWIAPDREIFAVDKLVANTATALTSDYQQSGSRPGTAEVVAGAERAQVVVRRAQDEEIGVRVRQGGMPGQQGASVIVQGEAGTWYGHTDCQIEELEVVKAPVLTSYDITSICARATTGYPVVGCVEAGGTTWEGRYWDGSAWQAATGENADASDALAMVSLPDGRLLAIAWDGEQIGVDYSDDGGATWAVYARRCMINGTPANTVDAMTAAYSNGEILLVMRRAGSSGDFYQFASDDLGSTFSLVVTGNSLYTKLQVAALPSGGFVWAGLLAVNGAVRVGQVGTATDYITTSDEEDVGAVAGLDDVALWVSETGGIYVMGWDQDYWYLHRSLDYQQTAMSCAYVGQWVDTTTPTTFRRASAAMTSRGAMVLVQWTAPSYSGVFDDGVYALRIGGWTTLERGWLYGYELPATTYGPKGANQFGDPDSTGWLYFGTEKLEVHGFTKTGAGSETIGPAYTQCTGVIKLEKAGLTRDTTSYQYIDVAVDAGGTVGAANQYFEMVFGNTSTQDYHYRLRVGPSGWRLTDQNNAAATLASGSATMSDGRVFVVGVDVLYHRDRGDLTWTAETFSSTDGGGAAAVFFSYESTDATADVKIRMLGLRDTAFGDPELHDAAAEYDGRPVSSLPMWLPVGGVGCQLTMTDGPAVYLDEWTIPPAYDYPVRNALPDASPSPSSEWRSGVETEQIIAFEPDGDRIAGWMGLHVERPRFRTAYIEALVSGSWSEVVTLDCATGLTSLDFLRTSGSYTISPAATPATPAARYIQAGELVGGYIIFATGACREITGNTAGSWATSATGSPRPRLTIDGDDTEPTSGSMVIVPPRACAIGYSSVSATRYRIRIPAQNAPGDSIGAGLLFAGRLLLSGAAPDWGWSESVDVSVERYVTPYGTPYAYQSGPTRRVWTWSWSDGVDLIGMRSSLDVDYLGPELSSTGTVALAADQDVWWQVRALYDITDGGAHPVVAIRSWPDEGVTINDPTRLLYGYLDSGGTTITGLLGTEGASEAVRVGTVVTREIK